MFLKPATAVIPSLLFLNPTGPLTIAESPAEASPNRPLKRRRIAR